MIRSTILATLALCLGTAALAHSREETTIPANGAVLEQAPDTIAMGFDSPMRVTAVTLSDADGTDYTLTRTDGMQPVERFEASAPSLPAGRYTVEWRGLAPDGHPMQGGFDFEIAP